MCFHKPGGDGDLWVPLKFCHQRGPLLPTRLNMSNLNLAMGNLLHSIELHEFHRVKCLAHCLLIYMNVIPECSSLFPFLLYADATPPLSHTNFNDGDSSYSPISIINSELAKVNDWLAVNKLSLGVKKTNYMFFFASLKKFSRFLSIIHIFGFNHWTHQRLQILRSDIKWKLAME